MFQLDRLRVHGTIATRARDADAIQAVDVLELLPETSGDITHACTELAWAYASAIRAGRQCDPGVARACMRSGALMQYVQLASGEILFEGLCTTCPAGVNAAEGPRAAAALEDYRRVGCDRLPPCWCPTWRLDPTWTPQCLPQGECQ